MQLYLWTQFSSNHSAGYTLVGQFPTPAQAQQVGAEIREILSQIVAWWEQFDYQKADEIFQRDYEYQERLTPPEEAASQKYHLKFSKSALDWCWSMPMVDDALHALNDLVIIDSPHDTWVAPYFFIEFMRKQGGDVHLNWCSSDLLTCRDLYLTMTWKFEELAILETVWGQISHSSDNHGNTVFELPGLLATRGQIERNGLQLYFQNVEVTPYFFVYPSPTFEQQIRAIFDFVKQYPCTITYSSYTRNKDETHPLDSIF